MYNILTLKDKHQLLIKGRDILSDPNKKPSSEEIHNLLSEFETNEMQTYHAYNTLKEVFNDYQKWQEEVNKTIKHGDKDKLEL